MKFSSMRRKTNGFTLVELLVVMAIIALLVSLGAPAYSSMLQKANSMKCATNLRSIGVAVNLYLADNNNLYPEIDQADSIIYPIQGPSIFTVLSPYNITADTLKCPVDLQSGTGSSYQKYAAKFGPTYASSYEWNPSYDDESANATLIYITATRSIPMSSGRIRLVQDFNGIHRGKPNVLYGDGHVTSH